MLEDALRSLEILEDDSPRYVARTIIEVVECSGKERSKVCDAPRPKGYEEDKDWVEITINSIEKL